MSFVQRRDGSGVVDIAYDLTAPAGFSVHVTLAASADGGATWDLDVSAAQGDVGGGVAPGPGRLIVWPFAATNPGRFGTDFRVRVSAVVVP